MIRLSWIDSNSRNKWSREGVTFWLKILLRLLAVTDEIQRLHYPYCCDSLFNFVFRETLHVLPQIMLFTLFCDCYKSLYTVMILSFGRLKGVTESPVTFELLIVFFYPHTFFLKFFFPVLNSIIVNPYVNFGKTRFLTTFSSPSIHNRFQSMEFNPINFLFVSILFKNRKKRIINLNSF